MSQPTPAQQAKCPTALQFGPDSPPAKNVKLTSTVMWCRLQQLPKMAWMTRLLSFLYGCTLPFSIVEHLLFKSLVSSLRPGYQPPSRQVVSNKLLDKCHDKYQAFMKQLLNNKTITMQQDGWSSVQNDPVIATSVVSDGKGYFVDAKDTGTTLKTAEACKAMFEDYHGCKIRYFVTDNARTWTRSAESWSGPRA